MFFDTILFDIILCLTIISSIIYYFVIEKYGYFKRRGLAYCEPVFLLGSTWRNVIGLENLVTSCHRIYTESNGPFIGMFQGLVPTFLMRDPALVEKVFIKEFSHFHDRGIPVDEISNPLEGNLFNLKGSKWKAMRNKLIPSFSSGKLKGILSTMQTSLTSFVKELEQQQEKSVELKTLFTKLNLHIIGTCAFGLDLDTIKNPNSKFPQVCKTIFARDPTTFLKGIVRFFFPTIARFFRFRLIPKETNDFFMDLVSDCFKQRTRLGIERNDFMQTLLELRMKGHIQIDDKDKDDHDSYYQANSEKIENFALTDEVLTAQAFGFFAGGFETSSTALSFLFYLLSKHPQVQEKLRKEILETKEKYGDITYEALKSMVYADACINESLRLYPPVGILARKCNKPIVLNQNLTVEKNTLIFVPTYSIQRDEANFPQPLTYNPERFLDSTPATCTFLPFGDGPRMCIARNFASVLMKAVVAEILSKYRVDTSPKMSIYEPLQYLPRAFVTTPKDGLHCIFHKLTTTSL